MKVFQTKKDMVYSGIKDNILSGVLRPGDRLHIQALAKEFSTSEIPVREAIQALESEKLVQVTPHTGAMVAQVSARDLDEILELRIYFEALATYLAAPFITEDDAKELEKNLRKQAFAIEYNELEDFGELNLQFHKLIYQKNPNSRLNDIIFNLWDHSKRYRNVFQNNLEFTKQSYDQHLEILSIIKQKDAEKARELMEQHKIRSSAEIKSKWKRDFE
ncbi:GntR family transcriptional regulator [Ferviditalea candida]|uniref:GntR family transcriptional regulator n=1 Tax=Ferviditalea candida TaxID=3108399 RepID=A0ABU5ZJN5_9BACL|nr:GntR family transcriptional regulator [Paenibacillaceae bacterium T2]